MRIASSGGQPRLTSEIASWRSTSNREASATASSPGKPTRISSLVRQRSTRSASVSTMSYAALAIRNLRISCSGFSANWISPSGGICAVLLDGRGAEQVAHGGEEVRLRIDAVLRPQLQQLRAERRDEVDVDGRLSREVPHQAGELADHPGRRVPRVHLQPHLTPFRNCFEAGDLKRDELRLPLLLVVDASLDDEDGVLDEQLTRGRVRRVEDDDFDRARHVFELDERHRLAPLR